MSNKLTLSTGALSKALKIVAPAVSTNGVYPILGYVKVEVFNQSVRFTANTNALTIEHTIESKNEHEFTFVIEHVKIKNILNAAPEAPITITDNITSLNIFVGNSKYDISTENYKDFPVLPVVSSKETITLPEKFCESMLNCQENIMPSSFANIPYERWLIDVHFDKTVLVACDNRTMFKKDFTNKNGFSQKVLVPIEMGKCLRELEGEVKLSIGKQKMMFRNATTRIFAQVAEGNYVDYTVILSKTEPNMLIGVDEMINAISNVMAICSDKSIFLPIKVAVENNLLSLSIENAALSETSNSDIAIENSIEQSISAHFTPKYLLRLFKQFKSEGHEKVSAFFTSPEKPALNLYSEDRQLFSVAFPYLQLN